MQQKFLLPPSTNPELKTLVLDLDETLVHSTLEKMPTTQVAFEIITNDYIKSVYVTVRPGAKQFLNEMKDCYEIVIFTAGLKEYANQIIDYLDPQKKCVKHRLFREHCTLYQGILIKDLNKLGRDLQNVIIIDNCSDSYLLQKENGYQIQSFFQDMNDEELIILVPFLKELLDDVREVEVWKHKFDQIAIESMENQQQNQSSQSQNKTFDPFLFISNFKVSEGDVIGGTSYQNNSAYQYSQSIQNSDKVSQESQATMLAKRIPPSQKDTKSQSQNNQQNSEKAQQIMSKYSPYQGYLEQIDEEGSKMKSKTQQQIALNEQQEQINEFQQKAATQQAIQTQVKIFSKGKSQVNDNQQKSIKSWGECKSDNYVKQRFLNNRKNLLKMKISETRFIVDNCNFMSPLTRRQYFDKSHEVLLI